MPTSDASAHSSRPRRRGWWLFHVARRWRGTVTALFSLLLAGALALLVLNGRIIVRDPMGLRHLLPVTRVWGALLDYLPAQAPGLLARGPLFALIALAGLASAYVLVATLRLPRPR